MPFYLLARLSVCLLSLQSAAAAAAAVIQVNAAFIHISKRIIPDVFHQNISKIMLIPFGRVPLNKQSAQRLFSPPPPPPYFPATRQAH